MLWFRNQINSSGYMGVVKLEGWPDGYKCTTTKKAFRSELFKDFHLSKNDCKPFDYTFVGYIAMGAVMFVIVVVADVGYRNRWYVQYYWHNMKKRFSRQIVDKDNLCGLILYDAYVVNHPDDSNFVNGEFKDRFETMLHYKAHIWSRDAKFGPKVDVILDAMDANKAAIVKVSNALLNWSWGLFQVDVAFARSIEDKKKQVFFVLLEDFNRASLSKPL